MNRIVAYLNKNIIGEATTDRTTLDKLKNDNSVITNKPSVAVFPRHTDDIRKTVKFCNNLAEKGKLISVCTRGYGNDHTGAAITDGAIINTTKYLNQMIDFDENQALIHVQAGIDLQSINNLVNLSKLALPLNLHNQHHSLGGLISNGLIYPFATEADNLFEIIEQLEIILPNGELLQTRRLSKRELNKMIGKTTYEANIYRQLDQLIDEHQELISRINLKKPDNYGYNNIARVKNKDGSFDLTPLFVGSQGTLGIINEAIIKLEPKPKQKLSGIMAFTDFEQAMDACDQLIKLKPTELNFFDSRIFALAKKQGNFFDYYEQLETKTGQSVRFLAFFDFNLKSKISKTTKAKKIESISKKLQAQVIFDDLEKIDSINNLSQLFDFINVKKGGVQLVNGLFVSRVQWRKMIADLAALEAKTDQTLPFYGSALTKVVNIHSSLDLSTISDRQNAIKTLEYARRMASQLDGVFCASGGEGQLKNLFAQKEIDPELAELYRKVKQIFDPNNILNSKVKQPIELKTIAKNIRTDYNNNFYD